MPSIPKDAPPPKFGRYILARQKKVDVIGWVDDARCKDSRRLHFVVSGQDAVHIATDFLPEDVTIWFARAGEDGLFKNDLTQFCHTVFFCRHLRLEGEEGERRWTKGFNIGEILRRGPVTSSDQFLKKEIRALLGNELYRHASQVMFVNFYGPPPDEMPAYSSSLFLHMISVLGHMKVNALLLERGASVRSLSHVARTFYASAYERRAALGLRVECYKQTMANPNPVEAEMFSAMAGSIEQEWLPEVNAKMRAAHSSMPREERQVFTLDPNVSPQDVTSFDRLVVELI